MDAQEQGDLPPIYLVSGGVGASGEQLVRGTLTVGVNGAPLEPFTFDAQSARGRGASYELDSTQLDSERQTVELSFSGTGQPRYVLLLETQQQVARAEARTGSTGLVVRRRYERVVRGRDGRFRYLPVTGPLRVDDVLRVTLVVQADRSGGEMVRVRVRSS